MIKTADWQECPNCECPWFAVANELSDDGDYVVVCRDCGRKVRLHDFLKVVEQSNIFDYLRDE